MSTSTPRRPQPLTDDERRILAALLAYVVAKRDDLTELESAPMLRRLDEALSRAAKPAGAK